MVNGINSSSLMAGRLFAQLDSKGQGYLEKTDFESAFQSLSSTAETSVDEVFSTFDSDSDGKITESEFASTLNKLQQALEDQFGQMRMQGGGPQGAGGMPPPPPQGGDEGFTQEELEDQLSEIGSSDSKRSALISSVVENFEAADADGDGKVSFQEAMAYDAAQQQTAGAESGASTASSETQSAEAQVMMQIMKLLHAYGRQENQVDSLLNTSA